ncbi:hypothetical protein [Metabacillus sp. 84]
MDWVDFEDKSERDEDGLYEYYHKGIHLIFYRDKELIKARIYDDEQSISFMSNPILAFGEEYEGIIQYICEKFEVNKINHLDSKIGFIKSE